MLHKNCATAEVQLQAWLIKKDIKNGRVSPKPSLGLLNIRREIQPMLPKDNYYDPYVENGHLIKLY